MSQYGIRGGLFFIFIVLGIVCMNQRTVAAVRVSSEQELRDALQSAGSEKIELTKNIKVSHSIVIKGEKRLDGKGFTIRRGQLRNACFGGTIFYVKSGYFSLQSVTLLGSVRTGKIYGRLIEVRGGKCIVGKQGVLCKNINKDSQFDGGGAVWVKSGGVFLLYDGEIRDNQSTTGGAAIRVESGGTFLMTGGRINANKAEGVGEIEGFDGRGGAVWNKGECYLSGGMIENNHAKAFRYKQTVYGGVGGMICNQGTCVLSGGIVRNNTATQGGGAIYTEKGAKLILSGGSFRENNADKGDSVFHSGGYFGLNGRVSLRRIYLDENAKITTGSRACIRHIISLSVNKKRNEKLLVDSKNKKVLQRFRLVSPDNHSLVWSPHGIRMESRRYTIVYHPNGGSGAVKSVSMECDCPEKLAIHTFYREGYYFAGWGQKQSAKKVIYKEQSVVKNLALGGQTVTLYAVWKSKPKISIAVPQLIFYEGERLTKEILCYGVKAQDTHDGDISGRIRVESIPDWVRRGIVGRGSIVYCVTNKQGKKAKKSVPIQIKENKKPVYQVSKRYFFCDEASEYSSEQWKQDLWEHIGLEDDCDSKEQLLCQAQWGNLPEKKAGTYNVRIKIRDQYGYRYYMKQGDILRYGKGKTLEFEIIVTLVEKTDRDAGMRLRFIQDTPVEHQPEEVWYFDRKELRRIKEELRKRSDPFSRETNQWFLQWRRSKY